MFLPALSLARDRRLQAGERQREGGEGGRERGERGVVCSQSLFIHTDNGMAGHQSGCLV